MSVHRVESRRARQGTGSRERFNRRMSRAVGAVAEALESRTLLAAEMVADINTLVSRDANPTEFTDVNGTLFFAADDNNGDRELWKSDGTAAGTVLVRNIYASGGSNPTNLTNVNGTLFFSALGVGGRELYRSDGTSGSTVRVADIYEGLSSSNPSDLTNVNGVLFFSATDGFSGGPPNDRELWKSNGALTVKVANINPSGFSNPTDLINFNGTLFFSADNGVDGREMWQSQGTDATTVMFKDIWSGANSGNPTGLTFANGTLFFAADDGINGVELWKSNGTAAGTTLVKNVVSGGFSAFPTKLTDVNGTLFYVCDDVSNGLELWKSNGTSAGTVLVKDIWSGANYDGNPENLTNVNGTLFFSADDGINGVELWKSDGSAAGTVPVQNIANAGFSAFPTNFQKVGSTLFFTADDGSNGRELWKSDGTPAGTAMVQDINPGSAGSDPSSMAVLNGALYFNALTRSRGNQLWTSDGTAAGTAVVKEISYANLGSLASDATKVNGTLFFSASDGINGAELWKSDGTALGTVMVKDIRSGSGSSSPQNLTEVNGMLYFTASDGINGVELWKSDGTAAGTVLLDILSGPGSSSPQNLKKVGAALFFIAKDASAAFGLWKTDGTAAGKVNLTGYGWDHYASNLTDVGDTLFYSTHYSESRGAELWKSHASGSSTSIVKDIVPGSGNSYPLNLTNVNGTLFFTAMDPDHGDELWTSDGTGAGTKLVKDIRGGSSGSTPNSFSEMNGKVFFAASDNNNDRELWMSDGTAAGTVLVKDVRSGSFSSNPTNLTNVSGTLFFTATTGVNDIELWKSDGTAAGTAFVKDIGSPSNLTNVNGTLFFSANFGGGTELWTSDGSAVGTFRVQDIEPGSGSSNPTGILANDNGTVLYFTATTSTYGTELWKLPITDAPTANASGPYTVAEGETITLTGSGADTDGTVALYEWDFAYDGTFNVTAAGASVPFTATALDGPSGHTVALRVTDNKGAWSIATVLIDITNTAPTLALPDLTIGASGRLLATGSFADPGADSWNPSIDYGDGTGMHPLVIDPVTKTFNMSRTYGGPGNYTATVTIFDGTDTASDSFTVTVPASDPPGITPAPEASYTIAGDGTLTITAGTVTISENLDGAPLHVAAGASVVLSGPQQVASLTIENDASATMTPGSGALVLGGISISGNGRLNLTDNDLLLNYATSSPLGGWNGSAYTGIAGWIQSGSNFGTWDGAGIVTSMPGALASETTLGAAEMSNLWGLSGTDTAVWEGHTVDATTIIVKYTYAGDANLDGQIDAGDYGILDYFIQQPNASGYANGDYNLDGIIDAGDYGVIDYVIQNQGPPL